MGNKCQEDVEEFRDGKFIVSPYFKLIEDSR